LRLGPHELMRFGRHRGRFQLIVARVGLADPEILGNRAVEEPRVLEDDRNLGTERCQIDIADVDAIDGDATGSGVAGRKHKACTGSARRASADMRTAGG